MGALFAAPKKQEAPVAPPPAPTIDEGRQARVEADRLMRKSGRASTVYAGRQNLMNTTAGYATASKTLLGS